MPLPDIWLSATHFFYQQKTVINMNTVRDRGHMMLTEEPVLVEDAAENVERLRAMDFDFQGVKGLAILSQIFSVEAAQRLLRPFSRGETQWALTQTPWLAS